MCEKCLCVFGSEKLKLDHREVCDNPDAQRLQFPLEGSYCEFKNIAKQQRVPFYAFADFESLFNVLKRANPNANIPENLKHVPCAFKYLIKRFDGKVIKRFRYIMQKENEDLGEKFVKCLEKDLELVFEALASVKDLIMTAEDEENYKQAENCYICCKEFIGENYKVRDHCHITGKYRGVST